VAAEIPESVANGPGKRYVLWVQGCPSRCPGCFNRDYQPVVPNRMVDVLTLSRRILTVPSIEGITYTGGEPFLQCRALAALNTILRESGLSIMSYTGYTLEELHGLKDNDVEKFISQLDILIDGRYMKNKKENLLWRGSKNQKVHFLTDRYRSYESATEDCKEIELFVGNDTITFTGILDDDIIRSLQNVLGR
jgi:anaerobic ribonucleoside-triphosphate reductase activating protein